MTWITPRGTAMMGPWPTCCPHPPPGPRAPCCPATGPTPRSRRCWPRGWTPADAAAEHPASCLAWALLAERAEGAEQAGSTVAAYAYARTGYHRGLDALRRAGWRGFGEVPFEHGPNRGFLRALGALGRAAATIGERDEAARIAALITECDPDAAAAISAGTTGTVS